MVDDLRNFLKGSLTFNGITFQGMYGMGTETFLIAFDHYLRTKENVLDEYSEIQYIGFDFLSHIDYRSLYTKDEILKKIQLMDNKGFWNIEAVFNEEQIREIKETLYYFLHQIKLKETKLYEIDDRHSVQYKNWRSLVFERDKFICQKCDQRGGNLHVHHILSFKLYPKDRYKVANGQVLCIDCHKKVHNEIRKNKKS